MKRFLLSLLLGAALLGVGAAEASACSCAGPAPGDEESFYRQALKRSDGAVKAKLLRRREVPDSSAGPSFGPGSVILTYRIRRVFKNQRRLSKGDRLRIETSGDGASCGIGSRPGRVDGLLLYRAGGEWTSNLCSLAPPRELRRASRRGHRDRPAGGSALCAA